MNNDLDKSFVQNIFRQGEYQEKCPFQLTTCCEDQRERKDWVAQVVGFEKSSSPVPGELLRKKPEGEGARCQGRVRRETTNVEKAYPGYSLTRTKTEAIKRQLSKKLQTVTRYEQNQQFNLAKTLIFL